MGAKGKRNVGEGIDRVLGHNPDAGWTGPLGGPNPVAMSERGLLHVLGQSVIDEGNEGPSTTSGLRLANLYGNRLKTSEK